MYFTIDIEGIENVLKVLVLYKSLKMIYKKVLYYGIPLTSKNWSFFIIFNVLFISFFEHIKIQINIIFNAFSSVTFNAFLVTRIYS